MSSGEAPDPHVALISMRLTDGTWLNVSLLLDTPHSGRSADRMVAWLIAAVALATAVLWCAGYRGRSARFAEAADGFYTTGR